jgi:hypothetical protein
MLARTRNVVKARLFETEALWNIAIMPDDWLMIGVIGGTAVALTGPGPDADQKEAPRDQQKAVRERSASRVLPEGRMRFSQPGRG